MATPNKTRIKAKAQLDVPQNRGEAAIYIRKIGDAQRLLARSLTEMNDAIAHVTSSFQPTLEAQKAALATLQEGLQSWCEANRDELTNGGKVKTANLVTGEISWRCNPPSVSITKQDAVIEMFQRLGLSRFIREGKLTVNKDAILLEPDTVRDLAGVKVVSGVEEFVITPFEQEAA